MSSRLFAAGIGVLTVLASRDGVTAELPTACVAGSCGPNVTRWVTSGAATATSTADTLRINQTTDRAVLNWQNFNVSADGHVVFQQPDANSIALNRIYQSSASKIFGTVEANGQLYLINQNGFVFGAGSRVKAAGLLASTLNISDEVFSAGLLSPEFVKQGRPVLESDGRKGIVGPDGTVAMDADGKPLEEVKLVVEQGAQLSTTGAAGGRVMLASQKVDNSGTIQTPGGQAVLAAGQKVYLQASSDPGLRGILVEVDSGTEAGGEAWNRLTGQISAPGGNITMVGLAVNQLGRVSATTTVEANGSVRLLARDTVQLQDGKLVATHGGTVDLGSKSSIEVLPDLADTRTAVDEQTQLQSSIEITGQKIFLRGGSSIKAPGGNLSVTAAGNPSRTDLRDADSRIRVEAGAVIDLKGSDANLDVSRNVVELELRANELKDSPEQRDGVLRGQHVFIDARVGTTLADDSGVIAAIAKKVDERTSVGGTAKFSSQGDIVVATGATVDVSGGALNYQEGLVQTTKLMGADGKLYDIGTADPTRTYVGLINPTHKVTYDRWGVTETQTGVSLGRNEGAYTEGRSAGSVMFAAPSMVLNGTLLGTTRPGAFQRDPTKMPLGGQLIVGLSTPQGALGLDYGAPSIDLVTNRPNIVISNDAQLPGPRTLELPVDFLTSGGFTRTELYSNGVVTLAKSTPLDLLPGSSVRIVANRIDLLSDITAPGGSLKMTADQTDGIAGLTLPRPGVHIADGVTLDVRGQWTNDALTTASGITPQSPVFKDGGEIDLGLTTRALPRVEGAPFDAEVVIGSDVNLLAGGGGWLTSSGTVQGGKGGRIAIRSGRADPVSGESALEIGSNVKLDAFGSQGAAGGSFLLEAARIEVVDGSEWASQQRLDASLEDGESFFKVGSSLFSDFGFASFDLVATGKALGPDVPEVLAVRKDVTLDTRVRTRAVHDAGTQSTGTAIESFSTVLLAPFEVDRKPSSVSMRVVPRDLSQPEDLGTLTVEKGSVMFADPGSTFSFTGIAGLSLAGQITTHGGTIKALVDVPPVADVGFRPDTLLDVTSAAWLDVSGTPQLIANDSGLQSGTVLAGGQISLIANRGSVAVRDGAKLDVSGTAAAIDFRDVAGGQPHYTRQTVASAGGSLRLRAAEAISFLGDFKAAAGVGDTGRAAGGSLAIELTRADSRIDPAIANTFPDTPRVLRVTSSPVAVAAGLTNGLALIETSMISSSGVDSLRLESQDVLQLDSGVHLNLARQITIETPTVELPVGGSASLTAPYVLFGNSVRDQSGAGLTPGSGTLSVSGDLIDLLGAVDLQNIGQATFASRGDIRLRGVTVGETTRGSLRVAGDLTLQAQRLYPTTRTDFSLIASGGADDVVRFQQVSGSNTQLPLAVGGSVHVSGKSIVQDGTLLAPFGTISLNASEDLQLTDRSVTSVSGDGGLFPLGRIVLNDWQYQDISVGGVPDRRVELAGDSVDIAPGAKVDLRGGGDLFAYEWTPGTGGSKDALAPGVTPGLYAVLPSMGDVFAPFDPLELSGSDLKPGDSVYLSGGGGLQAGVYALLPARYALLPGAFLVQAVSNSSDFAPGAAAALPDGTPIVSGYRTFANTGIGDTRSSGFAIRPGSYGQELASYNISLASTFFPAQAARVGTDRAVIPADAGSLALTAMSTLNARGQILASAATGGLGSTIEIAAPHLEVTRSVGVITPGTVQIASDVLAQWSPARVLLGGTRGDDGVEVVAQSVVFKDGAQLSFDELGAVATEQILVEKGATLESKSATRNQAVSADALADSELVLNGAAAAGAAVLALSDISSIDVQRTGTAETTATGHVVVESGAHVRSRGSLLFDSPAGASLASDAVEGKGAAWQLGSQRIAFGSEPISDGITLDSALLQRLQDGRALRLASSGNIDFLESVNLGGSITDLTLQGTSIRGLGENLNVSLQASTIKLGGASGSATVPAASGESNKIQLTASQLTLGPGALAVEGFGLTTLNATSTVRGEGVTSLSVGGDLAVNAGALTTATGASVLLQSLGTARLDALGETAPVVGPELGGALTVSGLDVIDAGRIVMGSGLVTLQASRDLSLLDGASIDVSGRTVTAAGRTVGSSGGTIALTSQRDLGVASGATLRMAGAGQSDAGELRVSSGGVATVAGTLDGHAAAGARGASFDLSADSLANFGAMNARLEAGGFTERRSVAVRRGDLALNAGDSIHARSVLLSTDNGRLAVNGSILAMSDAERSTIQLYASNGLTVGSTATLRADGIGERGRGGQITLGTSAGTVSVANGSLFSAQGQSEDGRIRIRAPRATTDGNGNLIVSATGNDVAITQFGARVEGPDSITVEPILGFDVTAAPTAANLTTIRNQVNTFVNAAGSAITGRLQRNGGPDINLEAGVELRRAGDLTLGALDLSTWRFDGQPIALSVRATGSITVTGTISDGFTTTGTQAAQRLVQMTGNSATLRFAAGAAMGSANPLAVDASSGKDFTLRGTTTSSNTTPLNGTYIRTGTGNIEIAAARDVITTAASAAAPVSIYTGGVAPEGAPAVVTTSTGASTSFAHLGGNLSISAGRNVVGRSEPANSITLWQARKNDPAAGVIWGPDFRNFKWTAGTLGGGDLSIRAGGDVRDVAVAAADSARQVTGPTGTSLRRFRAGSVSIESGGDITSAIVHAANGYNSLKAGGSLGSSRTYPGEQNPLPVGTLFLLQNDAYMNVNARGSVELESVLNPTFLPQSGGNNVNFYTYDANSALRVQSAAGDVTIQTQLSAMRELMDIPGSPPSTLPPNVTLQSLSGDVALASLTRIYPSDNGQLDIFAARDIRAGSGQILFSDGAESGISTPLHVQVASGVEEVSRRASGARHVNDSQPVEITAGRDILGGTFWLSKFANIVAGRDIINPTLNGQNVRAGDTTLISAGRDLRYTSDNLTGILELGGPGDFAVIAGRDVELGYSLGISTLGRLANPQIADKAGANVTVMAGLAQPLDVKSFLDDVIAGSEDYRAQLVAYVATETGSTGLTFDQASSKFETLSDQVQRPLLLELFFRELVASGREANADTTGKVGFKRGYAAIDALLPGSRRPEDSTTPGPYKGDITLAFSRIYTLSGGDISLLAPGGLINVGLANPPANLPVTRLPQDLGIVAQGTGNVHIFTNDDVLVNASRIFTLGGGNIAVWSTTGDIDAGRGAKSAISAPPPRVLVDSSGNVTIDVSGAAAGSGIRTIRTDDSVKPGDVDLIAPAGIVNAGDAGIGSAGNLNVAAQQVVGLDNIQVGGTSTGVPPETSGLGASLAAASSTSNSATAAADSSLGAGSGASTDAAPLANSALGWLEVFVEGFGDEVCKPNDAACLERNRRAPQ